MPHLKPTHLDSIKLWRSNHFVNSGKLPWHQGLASVSLCRYHPFIGSFQQKYILKSGLIAEGRYPKNSAEVSVRIGNQ